MTAATATTRSQSSVPWLIIIAGSLIAVLTFGPRSAMGFFQLPMLADTGWDRTTFGLAMAFQNLCWGVGQPFFGAIADRFGSWRVLASASFYAGGSDHHGLCRQRRSAAYRRRRACRPRRRRSGSFGILLSAFARNTTPEQRSMVFGICTAAGSAGMFLFAPLSQGLIDAFGWSDSLSI
jgi:MFS family permease